MMARTIETVVVLHVKDDGTFDVRIWGDERVCVFTIDENVPDDRVYEHLLREESGEDLKALLGDSPIGNMSDGRISAEKAQAMKAMLWKMQGNRLGAVEDAE